MSEAEAQPGPGVAEDAAGTEPRAEPKSGALVRTIQVNQMSALATQTQLDTLFSKCGEVEQMRLYESDLATLVGPVGPPSVGRSRPASCSVRRAPCAIRYAPCAVFSAPCLGLRSHHKRHSGI